MNTETDQSRRATIQRKRGSVSHLAPSGELLRNRRQTYRGPESMFESGLTLSERPFDLT